MGTGVFKHSVSPEALYDICYLSVNYYPGNCQQHPTTDRVLPVCQALQEAHLPTWFLKFPFSRCEN